MLTKLSQTKCSVWLTDRITILLQGQEKIETRLQMRLFRLIMEVKV